MISLMIACVLGLIVGYVIADTVSTVVTQYRMNEIRKQCELPTRPVRVWASSK